MGPRRTNVIDRRTFLVTTGCAAATMPLATTSRAAAFDAGIQIETLHRLSGLHPGFAYVAGLPGHLGMPFPQLMRWFATADARATFTDLQNACDVTCVIVGTRLAVASIGAVGPYAAIVKALGWTAAAETGNLRDADARLIAPFGATMALTMPRRTWMRLPEDDKVAIASAAQRMRMAQVRRYEPAAVATPAYLTLDTTAIDRVSEAVVAELASYDALTRRINSHYFAFKATGCELRSKNAV